ncbi:MAG: OstA-like protein [Bacteroidota bacterium]
MKNRLQRLLIIVLCLVSAGVSAQNRVKIESDNFKGRRGYRIFTENVHFTQGTTEVFCDSAVSFSEDGRVEAYGRVRVIDKADSLNITAKQMFYDPGTRRSRLRQDVVYRGPDFTLYTDALDYNMNTKQAQYYNGGRIVDEEMRLTSIFGDFDPVTDVMIFRTKVVLDDPQGLVKSEYLRYNTAEGMAYFEGSTQIIGEDGNVINAEEGAQYNTETREFSGTEARIVDGDYEITGDKSVFVEGYRKITGNVVVFSIQDSVTITGDEALYDEASGLTLIYGSALLEKPFGKDTLWLTADTLVSMQGAEGDTTVEKRMTAYNNVRIFKSDLQGVADSLIYNFTDSMIYFYESPAIWSEATQITGDSIWLKLGDGEVSQMQTHNNSFVVSQVTSRRFNQIKGRVMVTDFVENQISIMDVQGNGESIYFQVETDSLVTGMNKMVCSNMKLSFDDNRISRIKFYQNPEASFIPVHEMSEDKTKLEGFEWRGWQRPTKNAVVMGLAPPTAPGPIDNPNDDLPSISTDGLPAPNLGEDEEEEGR